ncbi:hypothetical protein O0I10_002982 [Lichtheimia ornata]|uniref:Uncharacterized protein n=1 Tax=Lichtheimia ornata TaxID=688661 RepID=A0AAD7V8C6_9FUNG|nr:uncharacterized protein O0I10_002982 [Lichtheimia ornata]KAJ8661233.1 hypothetical protein O0I10_002982 [Lichtheimia ornata]
MLSSAKSVSAAIGVPALVIVLSHVKSWPLSYTLRSWWLLRSLVKEANERGLEPEVLFTVVSQKHRCLYDDIDYNQHMNNSTFNKILDFGRIQLLYSIMPRIMMEPHHHIFCHNAGVMTLFKNEIRPWTQYTMQTRVWTWNEKWLWIQHRFLLPDGEVACLAVSKLVFKLITGKTVPPVQVFELCGHDVTDPIAEERRHRNWQAAAGLLEADKALREDPFSWDDYGPFVTKDGPFVTRASKL